MNTTLSCSRSEARCVGIKATVHGDQLKHWTGGVPCIVASCSHTTHPSFPDLYHAMDFSDKVEHEFEVLECSAVAYVKAGAREEGEVMGVMDSLRTNSREIW